MTRRRGIFVRSALHVAQVDVERPHRDLNLADRDAERGDQQQQRRTEDPGRRAHQADIDQKHRHDTQEEARDAENLHRAREVQAAAQVVDLRAGHLRGVLQVLLLERAHQLGVRQKTVGVGQQNQRHGRKQQGGGREREFFHRYRDLRCKDTLFFHNFQEINKKSFSECWGRGRETKKCNARWGHCTLI